MDPTKKRKLDENGFNGVGDHLKLSRADARKMVERFTPDLLQDAVVRHPDILSPVRAIADVSQRKLFISGLWWKTTSDGLRSVFSTFGDLEEAVVILDKTTGKSKGYGFVTFRHVDGALLALREPSKRIDRRVTVTKLAAAGNSGSNTNAADIALRKIFVSNVSPDLPADKLLAHFSMYGEIEEGPLFFDKQTGKSKGFALFVYKTPEGAQAALLDPVKNVEGRQLNCKLAITGSKQGKRGRDMAQGHGNAHGDGMGMAQPTGAGSGPGSLSGQHGGPVGLGSYGGYGGGLQSQPPLGNHYHQMGNHPLNSSAGGLSSVGYQAPSSVGGAGGYGAGMGGQYGGYGGPTATGVGGLGCGAGAGGLGGGSGVASYTQAPVPSQLPVQPAVQNPISSAMPVQPTAQEPVSSPLPVQPSPTPMYKNQLQEFAQRSAIALPLYQVVNEGNQHAPKFRSTVLVDGMSFTSELTFPHQKAAEQEAARLALEVLTKKIKEEAYSFIRENAKLCKSILNEYALKLTIDQPMFITVPQGAVRGFVSSMVFNGTRYTGDAAKSKKEAEHLVAHAAILSILGNPNSGMLIFHMIKSKPKFYDIANTNGLQPIYASGVSPIANTADSSVVMDHKAKEVVDPVVEDHNDKKVADPVGEDHKDNKIADPVGKDNKAKAAAVPVSDTNNAMLSTCQQSLMPRQEPTPEATESPNGPQQPVVDPVVKDHNDKKVADPVGEDHKDNKIEDPVGKDHKAKAAAVPVSDTNNAMLSTCQQSLMPRQEPTPEATESPNGPQQPVNALPTGDGSSSKRQRNNRYKANKKARRESERLQFVSQQPPPCSAAQ